MKPRTCLLLALLMAVLSAVRVPAQGATRRDWTGNASGFWSNPNNWDPIGVPQDGEELWFSAGSDVSINSMINDLPGLGVHSLIFRNHDYLLSGNPLIVGISNRLGAQIEAGRDISVTIDCSLILGASVTLDGGSSFTTPCYLRFNADINLNGQTAFLIVGDESMIEVSGSISGTGDVIISRFSRVGTIEFLGTSDNTFDGTFKADGAASEGIPAKTEFPTLNFNKQAGSVVANRLDLRGGFVVHLRRPHQIGDNATVCVSSGSQFLLHGNTDTIGNLCLTNSAGDTLPSVVDTGGATLSVLGDITAMNEAAGVIPTIRGLLGLPGPTATLRGANDAAPNNAPLQSGTAIPGFQLQSTRVHDISDPKGFVPASGFPRIRNERDTLTNDSITPKQFLRQAK